MRAGIETAITKPIDTARKARTIMAPSPIGRRERQAPARDILPTAGAVCRQASCNGCRAMRAAGSGDNHEFFQIRPPDKPTRSRPDQQRLAARFRGRFVRNRHDVTRRELTAPPRSTRTSTTELFVIPGPAVGRSPESIATATEHRFRVRRCAAPRNDNRIISAGWPHPSRS
jgi:hypothetical protein